MMKVLERDPSGRLGPREVRSLVRQVSTQLHVLAKLEGGLPAEYDGKVRVLGDPTDAAIYLPVGRESRALYAGRRDARRREYRVLAVGPGSELVELHVAEPLSPEQVGWATVHPVSQATAERDAPAEVLQRLTSSVETLVRPEGAKATPIAVVHAAPTTLGRNVR
jgi:hypothetical protein